MSGLPRGAADHPPHGHPDNTGPSTQAADKASTSSHPPSIKPDPTTTAVARDHAQQSARGQPAADATSTTQLSSLTLKLKQALRQYPDFPSPGILFEDIMPIFADPALHESLITALELHLNSAFGQLQKPDVIVGLESRGFLFGPSLALRIGASFVPVRKKGKLPGKTVTASYKKEYGEDFFQMQADSIKQGQRVMVVDDIIATGECPHQARRRSRLPLR